MSLDKKHIDYSTEYLLRYLKGDLSPKEKHAVEKAALEDPFLSDAIDGLAESANHASSFESDVKDLNIRLRERVSGQKRNRNIFLMLPQWQVAALILVLVGLTTLTITLIKNNSGKNDLSVVNKNIPQKDSIAAAAPVVAPDSIVASKTKETETVVVIPDTNGKTDQPIVLSESTAKNEVKKPKTIKVVPESETLEKKEQEDIAKSLSNSAAGLQVERQPETDAETSSYKPEKSTPKAETPTLSRARSKPKDSLHFIQGLVVDDSGRAIEGAAISLSNQRRGTVTDSNGYFILYPKNNDEDQEIAINSIGHEQVNSVVSDSSLQRYRMQSASSSLNEVVVTGYGTQKKKDVAGSVAVVSDKNSGIPGWQALNNYVNESIKKFDADSLAEGEEVISFEANKNGELSSFDVIKSVSPSHDAEVIRLLKSGPKLQPSKKKKFEIRVLFNKQ